MKKTITIDPITRIEGHAKISIMLDDDGQVDDAQFHVTQFRGFEKFTEGRPFQEMPSITARICGICPVSHLMASAKACDDIMAVEVPATALNLRRLMNLAQLVQSHALSFFHLSSPDFLLGMDAPVNERHVLGLAARFPEIALDGIRLRKFGQQAIEWLGGRRVHPAWVVPGGVNQPLDPAVRERILAELPQALAIVQRALDLYRDMVADFSEEVRTFANFPSLFMGLVTPEGWLEHYDGGIRVVDSARNVIADDIPGSAYQEYIGETPEPWTYLKMTYFKPTGYERGCYRVGPLARLNIADRCGTPLADRELDAFRDLDRGAVLSSFHYHHARLIEILFAIERMREILEDPDILDHRVRAEAGPNKREGIGVSEAPRGILIHHYRVDDDGLITWANLIIATGHNNMAMNRGILQAARHFVKAEQLTEGALNRVEAVIRCFDPCLSCSTHALGQMPLEVSLIGADGEVRDVRRR